MTSTAWLLLAAAMTGTVAQDVLGQATGSPPPIPSQDTGFAALQARGKSAMGVDQYTSVHHFDDLRDGGRIELQVAATDTVGVRSIRAHLRSIAEAFTKGDFRTPGFVHAGTVPGTAVMAAQQAHIAYRFNSLPGGGEVRILTTDPDAVRAVHEFLAFQRQQHRSTGLELHPASAGSQMPMMDSLNHRLDSLVDRMNRTSGNQRMQAMADVITELVTQRKTMQGQMHRMMAGGGMMGVKNEATGESVPADTTDHSAHHPPH